jgi:hypothetical protein
MRKSISAALFALCLFPFSAGPLFAQEQTQQPFQTTVPANQPFFGETGIPLGQMQGCCYRDVTLLASVTQDA